MELLIVLGVLLVGFLIYVGWRVYGVYKEEHVIPPDTPVLAIYDLMRTATRYHLVFFGFDWHDVWLGCYWKYDRFIDGTDGDYDRLKFHICLLPCVLLTIDRARYYQLVPKADARIDPVCKYCGQLHSVHPATLTETESCNGRY